MKYYYFDYIIDIIYMHASECIICIQATHCQDSREDGDGEEESAGVFTVRQFILFTPLANKQ